MSDIFVTGARTHNLRNVQLRLPRHQLTAFCGVSGSGKTSMALDTLYAEGQRRFVETFSTYTRRFLDQLDKPPVDKIDGIPPAIALTRQQPPKTNRATVATASEIALYLRMLFNTAHELMCPECERRIESVSAESAMQQVLGWDNPGRMLVGCEIDPPAPGEGDSWIQQWTELGFLRFMVDESIVDISRDSLPDEVRQVILIVDRFADVIDRNRFVEAIETAYEWGAERAVVFSEGGTSDRTVTFDDRKFFVTRFSQLRECISCGFVVPPPDERLFDFNNPLGACPECEGFGSVSRIDTDLVVPDRSRSLREGAIAPWNSPAYKHELDELLELADDYNLPVDVPVSELRDEHWQLVWQGVKERDFGGLNGFFRWLDEKKYKMHLRVFASRWRSYTPCQKCNGTRLREESLAYRLGGRHIADWQSRSVDETIAELSALTFPEYISDRVESLLGEIHSRLDYLRQVGLGYLELDRPLRTLSMGELQRVSMTSALGSTLVDLLYVLDEPAAGLHRHDVPRLVAAMRRLKQRGNTVLVVEHEEEVLQSADWVVEFGPRAGSEGGQVVCEAKPDELARDSSSGTGDWLAGRRPFVLPDKTIRKSNGALQLLGARGNNLKSIDVEFPLGVFCVVTGVSGAGKSTLVDRTLVPALQQKMAEGESATEGSALPYNDLLGSALIDQVVRIDQSPVAKSQRSNAATYVKAFDLIRNLLADTTDAQAKGLTPGHFSFNVAGGRCEECQGTGYLEVDMHFMADISMTCAACNGQRYRSDVLDVRYRGRNIAEILDMTVYDAFRFFRGENKLQSRLKTLVDVGLDYLPLGQPAATYSGGESQRLKLAAYLLEKNRGRTLFVVDEPAVGLHFSDIAKLIDCFDALVDVGHSLVIVEHNIQVILAADHLIDLGPGPAGQGGAVVVAGSPREVASCEESLTGRVLSSYFDRHARMAAADVDDEEDE